MLKSIWNDPVWSEVISKIIWVTVLLVFGVITKWKFRFIKNHIENWIYATSNRNKTIQWNFNLNFLGGGPYIPERNVWIVRSFQITGVNATKSPVVKIEGYIEIDKTAEKFQLYINKNGQVVELNSMLALPPKEQIDVVAFFGENIDFYNWKGLDSTIFIDRYTPFTFFNTVNGKTYKYHFSTERCKKFIDNMVTNSRPQMKGPVFKD